MNQDARKTGNGKPFLIFPQGVHILSADNALGV
jgi:hypothetical protein